MVSPFKNHMHMKKTYKHITNNKFQSKYPINMGYLPVVTNMGYLPEAINMGYLPEAINMGYLPTWFHNKVTYNVCG